MTLPAEIFLAVAVLPNGELEWGYARHADAAGLILKERLKASDVVTEIHVYRYVLTDEVPNHVKENDND